MSFFIVIFIIFFFRGHGIFGAHNMFFRCVISPGAAELHGARLHPCWLMIGSGILVTIQDKLRIVSMNWMSRS